MHLPKPNDGGDFTPPPAGVFSAICYRFIDLGTQQSSYQGQTKQQHKVMLSWEITDPDERMEDGKPWTISQRYTWSMSDKATLRKTLESWRGKPFEDPDFGEGGFDTKNLIGAPCLLSIMRVEKDGKTYANISSVTKLPKQMPPGTLTNEKVYFSLEDFDASVLAKLSDSLQTIIKASPEYKAIGNGKSDSDYHAPGGDPGWQPDPSFQDSDIPF
jgi:hypothetical protein